MSEDQNRTIARLQQVLAVTRRLAVEIELVPLLESIAEAACDVIDCERATVFVLDHGSQELYSKVATGVGEQEIRIPASKGIAGEVAQSGSASNVPDAYSDPRFNPEVDRQTGFKTRNMLTLPLEGLDGKRTGVLQLLNRRNGGFTEEDQDLAETLGSQAGVALQRHLLLQEYAAKLRIERELDIAREIQRKLLPTHHPIVSGYRIAGWNLPADKTGGDCFDFPRAKGDRLGVVLADATGHGITAAMCIAQFRSLVKATTRLSEELAAIATHVNELLTDDLPDDRFVTAFMGALSSDSHRIDYVSAGQGPLLHLHNNGDVDILPPSGAPLGVLNGYTYSLADSVVLKEGDIFCLMTDGFFEWADPDGEEFGVSRVVDLVVENRHEDPDTIIESLYGAVREFSRGTSQADDLTIILIQRAP